MYLFCSGEKTSDENNGDANSGSSEDKELTDALAIVSSAEKELTIKPSYQRKDHFLPLAKKR